jgi:hypothetical protein
MKLTPMQMSNLLVGDNIHEDIETEMIYFHNVNEIKEEQNWYQILTKLKELNMDMFGFAEINRTMRHGTKQKWEQITRKMFTHSRTITAESEIPADNYKPGGTMTTITGKWQARVAKKGEDDSGLGCWSYFKISSYKKSVMIMTAYRPCVSHGPSITWMQQWTLLCESGKTNPNPIRSFYEDLEYLLKNGSRFNTKSFL